MKTTIIAILTVLASVAAIAADTGLSPSSVKVKVYSVAVSTNADCSNATAIATYPSGQVFDFLSNPTILSGTIANGTYPCVILQMSDQVAFTPSTSSDSGNCVAGTEVTTPICNSGNGQEFQSMTVNADNSVTFGAIAACTAAIGNAGEVVPLVLSTTSTQTHGAMVPFVQPATASAAHCNGAVGTGCGIKLNSAFTVTANASGTFVVNFQGQVQDGGGVCGLDAPTFSFR